LSATLEIEGRIVHLQVLFEDVGYGEAHIRRDFPVLTLTGTESAPLAAFSAAERHDVTTSTMLGAATNGVGPSAHLNVARALASPVAFIAGDASIDIWKVGVAPEADEPMHSLTYGESSIQGRLRSALRSDRLLAAKDPNPQMSLIAESDDLLAYARRVTTNVLSDRVSVAMQHALTRLRAPRDSTVPSVRAQKPREDPARRASGLVVGAVAALMVADKTGPHGDPSEFDVARSQYPTYFSWLSDLTERECEVLGEVRGVLREDLNYEPLDATVVSGVYEQVMADRPERKRLGIFYTPPWLARRVMERVPIEDIPPDDRLVCDPACGSGTFLLAAYDRLYGALPTRLGEHGRRAKAQSQLAGYDTDEFAVEIARLALLVSSLPIAGAFDVNSRAIEDAAHALPTATRPTCVVTNPPWRHTRSKDGRRHEVSDEFLVRLMDLVKPNGFLAAVLPVGFLSSRKSADVRDQLTRRASIFEVWRLPEDTFGDTHLAPCVVFAQRAERKRPYLFRRYLGRDGWQARFQSGDEADEAFLTTDARGLLAGTLLRGPLDSVRDRLLTLPRLEDAALVRQGPPPWKTAIPDRGDALWLRRAEMVPPFGEPPRDALQRVEYPDDFANRHDDGRLYTQPQKILVSSKRNPGNPWRLKVGLDRRGVIPRESLSFVAPNGDRDTELPAFMAILSSSVASCWVDSLAPTLSIPSAVLRALPLPIPETWPALAAAGETLLDAARTSESDVRVAVAEAERAVRDAYEIDSETAAALDRHFAGFIAPEGVVRIPFTAPRIPAQRAFGPKRRIGAVLDVDGDELILWISGLTPEEGVRMQPPEGFPGWLCAPGATFECLGDCLDDTVFVFQPRGWMTDAEITRERVPQPA
jgi:hypothetical protein